MQAVVKGWVPADKRSRALTLIYSGHQLGSILSLLVSPLLITGLGWPWVFYAYGLLGFVWLAGWEPLIGTHPPLATPASSGRDLAAIGTGAAAAAQGGPGGGAGGGASGGSSGGGPLALRDLPWRAFLTNRAFLALLLAHATFGIGYNMLIAWLPTYFNQRFGVDVRESSFLSILPWLVMALATNASGWVADHLVNSKALSTTRTRKLLQVAGSAGPAACFLLLAHGPDTVSSRGAVALLTVAMGFQGLQAGGFASNHQDISGRLASVLFGITNAFASLAGSVFVYLIGVILDATGSWALVFKLVAAVNLASAAVYVTCATSDPQFD